MTEASREFLALSQALSARDPGAPARMEALARAGDPYAQMMVGEFRLIGLHGPRSFKKGFKLIEAAAENGQTEARRAHVYLTARGVGRKANPKLARAMLKRLAKDDRFAAVQDQLLDYGACRTRIGQIEPEVLSDDPRIVMWRGLFAEAEYAYLRRIGEPHMQRAMTVDFESGQGLLDKVRDADTTSIPMIEEDLIVQAVLQTIADATDTPQENGEALSILRYAPGQQYHPHYDAYPEHQDRPQRVKTALIWLNDDFEGGETDFPKLGLRVRGKPGDMLVFDNLGPDGYRDDRMQHAGMPVTRGVKWLASRWITDTDLMALPQYG